MILKALEKDGSTLAGFYDLPGGRIDEGEFLFAFEKIIKRELFEEIGNVKYELINRPVALGTHMTRHAEQVIFIFFEAEYKHGEILVSEEHMGYKWVDLKKINLDEYFNSGILIGIKSYLEK